MTKLFPLILLACVLMPGVSTAGYCPDFPPGPQLDRMITVCDILKAVAPEWTTEDCCHHFMVTGARDTYQNMVVKLRDVQKREGIRDDMAAFDVDLPLPTVPAPSTGIGQ